MLEPSLDLYGQAFDEVENLLYELVAKSRARYALIIDLKGFVLMHARALWAPVPPSLDSFATLVASNYSANRAIAQLFGEDGFQELVQQGNQVGTFIEGLGDQALPVTVYDDSANLGRIKFITRETAAEVRRLIDEHTGDAPAFSLGEGWSGEVDSLLDSLFGKRGDS